MHSLIILSSRYLTRFERKRAEEDVEALRRKTSRLRSHIEGSSVIEKLQQKLREYKEILNCSICFDKRKEVGPTDLFLISLVDQHQVGEAEKTHEMSHLL